MPNKLLLNLKHLQSTIPGLIIGAATFALSLTDNSVVQALASSNPKIAKWVVGIAGIATSLLLICGVGPKNSITQK